MRERIQARALGAAYEASMDPLARKASGSYFTPDVLIDCLLDWALDPVLDAAVAAAADDEDLLRRLLAITVCDPACGAGFFLTAAAHRIASRGPMSVSDVLRHCIFGVDLDPAAVAVAEQSLPGANLVVGNALVGSPLSIVERDAADAWCAAYTETPGLHWQLEFPEVFARGGFDVVIGNPPFLNQLGSATAATREDAALARALLGELGPYTDLSAVFLRRGLDLTRPGGRLALVAPLSLLAARDAAPVRTALAQAAALIGIWAAEKPVFEGIAALTCAVAFEKAATQGSVEVRFGPEFRFLEERPVVQLGAVWAPLIARGLGIPPVLLDESRGVLGDLAKCTADFRDQYYGLEPFVRESTGSPDEAPLITTGLIEPGRQLWGTVPTRFLKQKWRAPVVDLAGLLASDLGPWAQKRLVPKVLVATQGRVIEAVVDEEGAWLPCVPVLTVTPAADQMWHVLAVLMAPPVVAYAATTYAGTALSARAIKLSARQLAALPLPSDSEPWDRAAGLLSAGGALLEVAELMCAAYSVDDPSILSWWTERARI